MDTSNIPQARELLALMPETEVIDTGKLLTERSPAGRELDVMELAERINQFQKRIDPDSYASFYPDEENHRNKIAMQLLVKNGKERYRKWLDLGGFVEKPELSDEIKKILEIMQASEYQKDMLQFIEESRKALNYGGVLPSGNCFSFTGSRTQITFWADADWLLPDGARYPWDNCLRHAPLRRAVTEPLGAFFKLPLEVGVGDLEIQHFMEFVWVSGTLQWGSLCML